MTYKNEFEEFLVDNKLNATLKERCSGNNFLKVFKFYMYEAEVMAN